MVKWLCREQIDENLKSDVVKTLKKYEVQPGGIIDEDQQGHVKKPVVAYYKLSLKIKLKHIKSFCSRIKAAMGGFFSSYLFC